MENDENNDLDEFNIDNDDGDLELTDYMQCLDDTEIKDEDYLYQIPELSRVISNFGKSLKEEDWIQQKKTKLDLDFNYYSSNDSIKEPFKYMSNKILESNEALNEYLDNFIFNIKNRCQVINDSQENDSPNSDTDDNSNGLANIIKDLADEDSFTTKLRSKTAVETYYAGRIRYGIKNGKLNYKLIYLEAPFSLSRGEIVPLDLSFLKNSEENDENHDYSLFPGKIVILKGQNFDGNRISVSKLIKFDQILEPNFSPKCPKILLNQPEALNIVCACGPFIKVVKDSNIMIDFKDTTNMKAIADYIKHYNPDVLFLFGPFFEESMYDSLLKWSFKSEIIDSENIDFPCQWNLDKLFNHQIRSLCQEIEGTSCQTQIVMIPSSNEFGQHNIYPMYPKEIKSNRKILSFSNPALINLGGIAIGLTSTDILLPLSRHEIHKIKDNDKKTERLQRLCGHILNHRHFYPMLPADKNLNMEYSMYSYMKMTITPHLLILPSMLRPFVYNVNGTVVVNPGKISKNAITRIMVEPLKDKMDYNGSLSNNINVEIIKLKH